MRRSMLISLVCLVATVTPVLANPDEKNNKNSDLAYQPFPPDYHYLNQGNLLSKAVKDGDRATIRSHAWHLWAGIMQPAKDLNWPIWYTWPTSVTAFHDANESVSLQASSSQIKASIMAQNKTNAIRDHVPLPLYPIPEAVRLEYPKAVAKKNNVWTIESGSRFMFNENILIPTESLSQGGINWIRNKALYKKTELNKLHSRFMRHEIEALQAPKDYIVTKHMYWPVKATGLSAIPVWRNDYDASYTGYAGYENWKTLIAVDPSGKLVGQTKTVSYLYGVWEQLDDRMGVNPDGSNSKIYRRIKPVTAPAKVYGLHDFYHHKITPEEWEFDFNDNDRAIINASSHWAYNKPFGPGDYLVTIAMHINTKEIPSWALQSVWWSDEPDNGPYAADRPDIPNAKGPWKHYKLVDSYGIPDGPGGNLPVAMNPYIELVIHPVATNCQNCHRRAGWPRGETAGKASYQNPDCPSLVAPLTSKSDCLEHILLTDFQWIIPDHAIPVD